jgi:tetratricopeptide (TPR) repeat protein
MVGGALLLALAATAPLQDTSLYARAESLLVEGELGEARRELERAVRRDREDARALTLLGRVHLEWPVIGRWKAWDYLERAAKADTSYVEARYWQVQVGLHLAMEDGQWMIRRALLDVWRMDAEYRDTWEIADQIYWNNDHRRQAAEALAHDAGNPHSDLRRAWFLTQANEYPRAAALIDSLVAAGRDDAAVWALKAQCALERGDTTGGLSDYELALQRAESDTLGLLWRQVSGIASPEEDSLYAMLSPAERETFLRSFWSRREPDLNTAENERIVEHFARLAHARDYYPLLHPQATFHRSEINRTLYAGMSGAIIYSLGDAFGLTIVPMPGRSRLEDDIARVGLGVDIRDLPEPDSLTRYRNYGFDGRGLVYLRYGEPDRRLITVGPVPVDAEQWYYETPNGIVAITFASVVGDMLVYPTNRTELHNSALVLETEDTSLPAELDVDAWVATFRGAIDGYHLVYVGATPDSGAVALWDTQWTEIARVVGSAPFVFHVGAGRGGRPLLVVRPALRVESPGGVALGHRVLPRGHCARDARYAPPFGRRAAGVLLGDLRAHGGLHFRARRRADPDDRVPAPDPCSVHHHRACRARPGANSARQLPNQHARARPPPAAGSSLHSHRRGTSLN